jgi:hypothetical protein
MNLNELRKKLDELATQLEVWACEKCRICGSKMVFMSSSKDGSKYACETAVKEWERQHYHWSSELLDHINNSESYSRDERQVGYSYAAKQIRLLLNS